MACRAVTALGAILLASATWAHAQQPGIQRKSLLQQDGPPGLPDDHQRFGVRAGRTRGQAHTSRSVVRLRLGRNADP